MITSRVLCHVGRGLVDTPAHYNVALFVARRGETEQGKKVRTAQRSPNRAASGLVVAAAVVRNPAPGC